MCFPPELRLDREEAERMATAQLNFEREFNVTLPPKLLAGMALFAITAGTYKPKLGKLAERLKAQRQAATQAADPHHFAGPVNQPWNNPLRRRPADPPPRSPAEEVVVRSGAAGPEFIMPTGAPDGGRIKLDS